MTKRALVEAKPLVGRTDSISEILFDASSISSLSNGDYGNTEFVII
jgi:hypothetical protein